MFNIRERIHRPAGSSGSAADTQLRRDRISAIVLFVVLAAVMALLVWLASIGEPVNGTSEYWPMMP